MGLNEALKGIRKKFGDRAIYYGDSVAAIRKMPYGIPSLDYVTCGGVIINRVNEHAGDEGSTKSYSAYLQIAQFQKYDWANDVPNAFTSLVLNKDGTVTGKYPRSYKPKNTPLAKRVVLIDVEGTYTPEWGTVLGIDNATLIVTQPPRITEVIDTCTVLAQEIDICLVVVDSMSAVGTDAEIDKSMEDNQMGGAAAAWNKGIRKIQSAMNMNEERDITFIMMNSFYSKVGMVFGDPNTIRNGNQMKKAKSLSVAYKPAGKEITVKDEETGLEKPAGRTISVKCTKNKGGGPTFREAKYFYSYIEQEHIPQYGTDKLNQIAELGVQTGLIVREGKSYIFGDHRAVGLNALIKKLIEKDAIGQLEKDFYTKVVSTY